MDCPQAGADSRDSAEGTRWYDSDPGFNQAAEPDRDAWLRALLG